MICQRSWEQEKLSRYQPSAYMQASIYRPVESDSVSKTDHEKYDRPIACRLGLVLIVRTLG